MKKSGFAYLFCIFLAAVAMLAIIPPGLCETITVFQGTSSSLDFDFITSGSEFSSYIRINEPRKCVSEARMSISGAPSEHQSSIADIVLLTDVSGSMASWTIDNTAGGVNRQCDDPFLFNGDTSRMSLAKCLDKELVDTVLDLSQPDIRLSLVSYTTTSTLDIGLTADKNAIYNKINGYTYSGHTCISCGLQTGINEIVSSGNPSATRTIVLMTDGLANRCKWGVSCTAEAAENEALDVACNFNNPMSAVSNNIIVHTIGFGGSAVNEELLRDIASCTGGIYDNSNIPSVLSQIYSNIASVITTSNMPRPQIDIGADTSLDYYRASYLSGTTTWSGSICPGALCYSLIEALNRSTSSCASPPCNINVNFKSASPGKLTFLDLHITTETCQNFCGNEILELQSNEQCDDGNINNIDDCLTNCSFSYCGDGYPQNPNHYGEEENCDDGNKITNDKCANDCTLTQCGDGIIQLPNGFNINEQCDDGNSNNLDKCLNNCKKSYCRDGYVQSPNYNNQYEQCDDGNSLANDACSNTCTLTICGDGIIQLPNGAGVYEGCDDGNTVSGDGCPGDCSSGGEVDYCGDGIIQSPNAFGRYEQCDDGNKNNLDSCLNNCSFSYCGDKNIQKPNYYNFQEQCDDGNLIITDRCANNCTFTRCGDGTKQRPNGFNFYEDCDDGNIISGDGCSSTCKSETFCGDGIRQWPNWFNQYENCDDKNTNNYDSCLNNCTFSYCGDGYPQAINYYGKREECDDGNAANTDNCLNNCSFSYCGDGYPQALNHNGETEECDDTNKINGDGCSALCKNEVNYCGDGITQKPNAFSVYEDCDYGPANSNTGLCLKSCAWSSCGDGFVQVLNHYDVKEQCDDDNNNNFDMCLNNCSWSYCGDGYLQALNHNGETEECDDSNKISGDGCSAVCRVDSLCGNGDPTDPGEECDDSRNGNGDACLDNCSFSYCGDGYQQALNHNDEIEACDGENGCGPDCQWISSFCGDSHINMPNDEGFNEECDEGNNGSLDMCLNNCTWSFCGDRITQALNGHNENEECDDGNSIWGDGGSVTCLEETITCKTATVPKYLLKKGEELSIPLTDIFRYNNFFQTPIINDFEGISTNTDITVIENLLIGSFSAEANNIFSWKYDYNIIITTDKGIESRSCPVTFFNIASKCNKPECDACIVDPVHDDPVCLATNDCLDDYKEIMVFNPYSVVKIPQIVSFPADTPKVYTVEEFRPLFISGFVVEPPKGNQSTYFKIRNITTLPELAVNPSVIILNFSDRFNNPNAIFRFCPTLKRINYRIGEYSFTPNTPLLISGSRAVSGFYDISGFVESKGPYIFIAKAWLRE